MFWFTIGQPWWPLNINEASKKFETIPTKNLDRAIKEIMHHLPCCHKVGHQPGVTRSATTNLVSQGRPLPTWCHKVGHHQPGVIRSATTNLVSQGRPLPTWFHKVGHHQPGVIRSATTNLVSQGRTCKVDHQNVCNYLRHYFIMFIAPCIVRSQSAKEHLMGYKESRVTLACLFKTSGRFYKLQMNSVDSQHFTQVDLSIGWSD